MKFTLSNLHLGEISTSNISYDKEGNITNKDERNFGGFDTTIEVELTPEEMISYHKTLVELLNGCGPLIDKISSAIVKAKTH